MSDVSLYVTSLVRSSYQNRNVGNELDEDEFAPENVERNIDRILTHSRTYHNRTVCLRIRLKKKKKKPDEFV
jgi:hypothetical protein